MSLLAAFLVFAATRFYYFDLAFIALRYVHRLPARARGLAYGIGYIFPALVGVAIQVGVMWLIGEMNVRHWD